ncbi:MAG TPA: ThiF family adenylyltransferase [Baekduia sp.]|uniref:ThiF family adenylyltransferase n=1 Tax=Baekduia sp. TaxID=2600305 RepID=UPI002CE5A15A|nr:ThiF family adenylyltransferase [Baekduia sp.]HMJ33975.1 ThiF family adenylyltransferase [Baekduia sp.]
MIDVRPWFERFPDLLAWELARFVARELSAAVDEDARAAGRLVIHSAVTYRGEEVPLQVAYPSEYPELPPVVYGPAGLLSRHQHPFGGNFCLLERPLDDWKAQEWGGADLVTQQLRRLLADAEQGEDVVRGNEAPMPEPATAHFQYARDASVLVPADLVDPDGDGGVLTLARLRPRLFLVQAVGTRATTDAAADTGEQKTERLRVPWRRLACPPLDAGPAGASVHAWILEHHPDLLSRPVPRRLRGKGRIPQPPRVEIAALTFPEEAGADGSERQAWLFLYVDHGVKPEARALLHAQHLDERELRRRTPELGGLARARVVVAGAGTMGAHVAVELAKAGVGRFDILDFDRLELGNIVRHRLDLGSVGDPKAEAVASACQRSNPYCEAEGHHLRFGEDEWPAGRSPLERVAALLDGAHLLVEATGSHQVAQFLGRVAGEADVPMVSGWMTDGLVGAEFVRCLPGRTACFTCLTTAHRTGALPQADRGIGASVVVQGCSHPTVSGAGLDATEAAAILTRMAVGTLAPAGGYPDADWDYAAVSFRRRPDDAERPRMAVASLPLNPDCDACRAAAGSTGTR